MAATKKGTKTGTPADASAIKSTASSGKTANRNTKAATAADGTNPSASKSKPAPPKKVAPLKLTEKQVDFLKKIHAAGATGYEPSNKNEERSIESLAAKKLLKRGKKNKEKGVYAYMLTKTGEKHLAPPASQP